MLCCVRAVCLSSCENRPQHTAQEPQIHQKFRIAQNYEFQRRQNSIRIRRIKYKKGRHRSNLFRWEWYCETTARRSLLGFFKMACRFEAFRFDSVCASDGNHVNVPKHAATCRGELPHSPLPRPTLNKSFEEWFTHPRKLRLTNKRRT